MDGSRETPLVEHPANDLFPIWTPDGKNILFASDRTGTMALWAVPVADGKAQGPADLIKPDIGRVFPMGFTQKGTYFYGLETGRSDVYVSTLDLVTGKMRVPPSKVTQRFVGANSSPEWSPDGRRLAYISNRSHLPFAQGKTICIRSLESGEERELALKPSLGYFNRPRWSPDGCSLLTSGSDRKGRVGVFRIDAQTGEVNLIVREEPDSHLTAPVNAPMWSPDGRAIFYVHANLRTKITRLLRRDLESGQEREIVRSTDTAFPGLAGWTISPDGRQVVFQTMDPPKKSTLLNIVPTDGGESRELLRTQEFVWLYGWTPDGRELIFANKASVLKAGQPTELWRMPVTGGKPQRLDLAIENLQNLRFHPDGQRVAFSAGAYKAEVWVMENFLPVLTAAK
jgi:Tol biopolymer transport system component